MIYLASDPCTTWHEPVVITKYCWVDQDSDDAFHVRRIVEKLATWKRIFTESAPMLQVKSGAFTHFECGNAACFSVRNWRILHTKMKGRRRCSTADNFRGHRYSSVLENQMQIWWTNFGVWLRIDCFQASTTFLQQLGCTALHPNTMRGAQGRI